MLHPSLTAVLVLGLAAGVAGTGQDPAPEVARFVVIVHVDNKFAATGDAARAVVKQLFLKELSHWPDGTDAKAYARDPRSAAQEAFRRVVLEMSEAELARHWLKMKSRDGTTPPKEVDSDRLVLKYVAKNPFALGIVELASAKDASDVRTLLEF